MHLQTMLFEEVEVTKLGGINIIDESLFFLIYLSFCTYFN